MNALLVFVFVIVIGLASVAEAQIPTCTAALAAQPQGPFPCSVIVGWADNSNNELGFWLYRRLNAGPWVKIGGDLAVNTTSIVDATLQQSQTVDNVYDYKVSAYNSVGEAPGVNPVTASFTIPKAQVPAKPPTGITVTFKGASGELLCPTCTGGDRKVPLGNDDGTLVISSAGSIIVEFK